MGLTSSILHASPPPPGDTSLRARLPEAATVTETPPLPSPATPHTDELLTRRTRLLDMHRPPTGEEALHIVQCIIEHYLALHPAVIEDETMLRDAVARGASHVEICVIPLTDLQRRFEEYDPLLRRSAATVRWALCHYMSHAGYSFAFQRCTGDDSWRLQLLL